MPNPSWREIKHFVDFLNIQLRSCEESVYCNVALVGDILAGLKRFVVRFMIGMSKDFATPSLEGEVARQNQAVVLQRGELGHYQIDTGKIWERRYTLRKYRNYPPTSLFYLFTVSTLIFSSMKRLMAPLPLLASG